MDLWFHDGVRQTADPPRLTVLNYSGGRQSAMLAWMLIRGELPRPDPLLVLNADPGMENEETYRYNALVHDACVGAGIEYAVAKGPNLLVDLLETADPASAKTRGDFPPYWVMHPGGKRGKLPQKCTREYKIRPMDRFIRAWLWRELGLHPKNSHLGEGIVEKWIGFTFDEVHRIKPPSRKYQRFRFPLVDMGLTMDDVLLWYKRINVPTPPRSLCNACFAHGLSSLESMYRERPSDWEQAVAVDRAVRDLTHLGIKHPGFVNDTLLSLEDLARGGFGKDDPEMREEHSCDSGYCFT